MIRIAKKLSACRAATLLLLLCSGLAAAQGRFEEAPISYRSTPAENPVARLQADLENGITALSQDDGPAGLLQSLLAYFQIPLESQVLVFSKTSKQTQFIFPESPRAIYFNDDVYVGAVHGGGAIEISVADPALGAVFYTLTPGRDSPATILRENDACLQCHASSMTRDIPGHLVRSVYTDARGFPILKAGSNVTTQNTRFDERWGGWYVTGTHGAARHMGNSIATETDTGAELDREAGANLETLHPRVRASSYLTPHSDIVALMVLEHQTQMHNLITQANFAARLALRDQAVMDEILERPAGTLSDSTRRRINNAAEKLVDYMLFTEEDRLDAPIAGTSGFAEVFQRQGPVDSQGRSLRALDLETRLFQYPLSYLIYSPQFRGLPSAIKDAVFARIWAVLDGSATLARRHYPPTPAQCQAIREILLETMDGLPAYWKVP